MPRKLCGPGEIPAEGTSGMKTEKMMKAAVLHGDRDIRYEDWPEPLARPGTVKVRVMACGICGSDIPRVLDHGAHFYPIVLGHEFSGYVVEAGEGVNDLAEGDHVAGVPLLPCMECADCRKGSYSQCKNYSFIGSREQGAYADYVVLPEKNAVRIDPSIPYEQGALFEPCTVALHGLRLSGYRGGKTVAVLGGGTIGLFALQWAKIYGASRVAVFGRSQEHLKVAEELGADAVISTLDEDFMKQARKLTGGKGFDYVYETAGSTVTMKLAFELAANHAEVCFIGTPTEELRYTPREWENINRKEFRLTGSWMSCSAPFPGSEWEETAHFFATGQMRYVDGLVHAVYPMEDAGKAFREFEDRGKVKGRILLVNGEG